jgi:hypothetical protein
MTLLLTQSIDVEYSGHISVGPDSLVLERSGAKGTRRFALSLI